MKTTKLNERGEAVVIAIVLTVCSILGVFGAVKYEDHLARKRMAEAAKSVQVGNQVPWDKLPNEGEIR